MKQTTTVVFFLLFSGLFLSSCASTAKIEIPPFQEQQPETEDPFSEDIYTTREIRFSINRGERIADLCLRWETGGVLSCNTLYQISDREVFPDAPSFLPPPGSRARFEGMFVPGDYEFRLPVTDETNRGRLMLTGLLQRTKRLYESLSSVHGLTPFQQMILASMVEKESVIGKNYNQIAEVFLRRLAKQDRLGSCPTVEYVLGYHRPFLLFKDLEIQSPYNVYKRRGLPPTPISFFQPEALEAVHNPSNDGNYFFVFNWVNGQHDFSPSGEIHMQKAKAARADFIEKFGRKSLYRIVPNVFYDYGAWITRPQEGNP